MNFVGKRPANITRLLKIIAANFVTKKAGQESNISWESLQSKYYHTEGAAKEIVKDILIKMMNEVRKK